MPDLHRYSVGELYSLNLPLPGAHWPIAEQRKWLEAARNILGLIYRDPPGPRAPGDG